jgi:hypothetical protein
MTAASGERPVTAGGFASKPSGMNALAFAAFFAGPPFRPGLWEE